MPADADGGIDQSGAPQGLQAEVGEGVGEIVSLCVASSDHDRDRQTIGDVFVDEEIEAFDQEEGILFIQFAAGQIGGEKWPEGAVQVAGDDQADRFAVHDTDQGEPQELDDVAEGGRRSVGDASAGDGYFFQFQTAIGSGALCGFGGDSSGVFDHERESFQGVEEGLVGVGFSLGGLLQKGADVGGKTVDASVHERVEMQFAVAGLSGWSRILLQVFARCCDFLFRSFAVIQVNAPGEQFQVVDGKSYRGEAIPEEETATELPGRDLFAGAQGTGGDQRHGGQGPAADTLVLAIQQALAKDRDARRRVDTGLGAVEDSGHNNPSLSLRRMSRPLVLVIPSAPAGDSRRGCPRRVWCAWGGCPRA